MESDGEKFCVIDTDVLINLLNKRKGAAAAIEKLRDGGWLFCTTIYNAYELLRGAYHRGDPQAVEEAARLIDSMALLPFSYASSRRAAIIAATLDRAGQTLPSGDVIIAAIAIENNASLLTENKSHLARVRYLKLA